MQNILDLRYKKSYISQAWKQKKLFYSAKKTVCNRKTSSDTWSLPSPLSIFRFNPRKFVRDFMRPIDRAVLNRLVYLSQKYTHIYQSQTTIAVATGYTRQEVNASIGRLRAWGLVRTIYRHWQPCIYKLTSLLRLRRVITKIGSFITSAWNYLRNDLTQLNYLVSSKLSNSRKSCPCSYLTYNSKRDSRQKSNFLTQSRQSARYCPPGFRPNKRHVMTKEEISYRVKAIEEICQTLDLSRYGKANLSIFPDTSLRIAHDKLIHSLKRGVEIKNPFAYLHELAHKATQEQNLKLDYSLFERYNFSTAEKNPLNSKKINIKGQTVHQAYKQWVKPDYNYDYEKEVKRYHEPEKIDGFAAAMANLSRLLGEEGARQNFEAFKMRFTKKAIECASR